MSVEDTGVACRQALLPLHELLPAHGAEQLTSHFLSPSAPPTPCVNQTLRPDGVSSAQVGLHCTLRLDMASPSHTLALDGSRPAVGVRVRMTNLWTCRVSDGLRRRRSRE